MGAQDPVPSQAASSKWWATIVSIATALEQDKSQVFIRKPGDRLLSGPLPVEKYAEEHWQFAHLANAAYQDTPEGQKAKRDGKTANALNSNALLEEFGWELWNDLLPQQSVAAFTEKHLRVEVWLNERDPLNKKVAVCFGGTVFSNWSDWEANLRWFIPKHDDEYSLTVRNFAPAFAEAFKARYTINGKLDTSVEVYAVGHSLGGGLAQQFAYCMPDIPPVGDKPGAIGPKITKVYAFDPSPVTGFFSVPQQQRDANVQGLLTDRVYERGEVLASLRAITGLFVPPSRVNPEIWAIRYSLFFGEGNPFLLPLTGHSIVDLAMKLTAAAKVKEQIGKAA